jgi:acetyl-CoA C-acetyltransferase
MSEVVIVSMARTPIGSFLGGLAGIDASQLGSIAIKAALQKIDLNPDLVDEVLMGNVLQANGGQAPARQAAIFAGIPDTVPCTTINKVCASGLKSIMIAAQMIKADDATIVVAGGMENMSSVPHYYNARKGVKLGDVKMTDGMVKDGLTDVYNKTHMGTFADLCASQYKISRERQDEFAIESYSRSAKAWEADKFKDEVVPVEVPQRRGEPKIVKVDEEFTNVRLEKIPTLRPVFTKEGSVTAANASTLNDGAAAVVVMSLEKANELGLKPLAKIIGYADAAQDPKWFTTSPAKAVPIAVKKAGIQMNEIAYYELNEAFSVVGLVNMDLMKLDPAKVNVNGGAVSLGHPLGMSGTRIVMSLISVLKQNNAKIGAVGICNGGGGAGAMVLERM